MPGPPPNAKPDTAGQPHLLVRLLATGCFTGYVPWASGTIGSLVGLLVVLIPGVSQPLILSVLIFVGFAAGVLTSARVAAVEGHKLSKTAAASKAAFQSGTHSSPDPSIVVIDEIVGMWITLLFVAPTLVGFLLAFLAFRAFDILKPQPAVYFERIGGGWGIMLDDVVAGVYANLATHLLLWALNAAGVGVV